MFYSGRPAYERYVQQPPHVFTSYASIEMASFLSHPSSKAPMMWSNSDLQVWVVQRTKFRVERQRRIFSLYWLVAKCRYVFQLFFHSFISLKKILMMVGKVHFDCYQFPKLNILEKSEKIKTSKSHIQQYVTRYKNFTLSLVL